MKPANNSAEEEFEKLVAQLRHDLAVAPSDSERNAVRVKLARCMSHSLNSMFAVIIGYSELALEDVPTESEIADELREILRATERATRLVAAFQNFDEGT